MRKFLVLLSFLCTNIAISPLRMIHDIGIDLMSLLAFILNFILITFFLNKFRNKENRITILLLALFGVSIISIPLFVSAFLATLGSLLDFVFTLLAILGGYVYSKLRTAKSKYIYIAVSVVFILFGSTLLADLWSDFVVSVGY